MGRLDGKVAIITGASRGQGEAEVKLFVREGAKVCFGDILDEEGMRLEAEIRELGGEATYVHLDVTKEEEWQRAIQHTEATYGRLDILVNNAGISIGTRPIEETSLADWEAMQGVNSTGVFLGTKYSIPALRRSGGGSIVNISSAAGLVGIGRSAGYTASKGAVRLFTKATAIQHAKENIRCNSVHPGPVNTPFIQELLDNPDRMQERVSRVPLGKIGTPDDIAYGVLYLASDEASFVTGSELVIDGGTTAQ
ncbi:MAG: glucose 1-dehydrogenase [Dehalococcoidia bacterium]|jgi:NAD(P)-dependent dehydrogenase (short-subunit alcohol dehydrogenase family)|nr:glucose 1-dehydrogenase [Dehalococcoidia bacterium]